MDFTKWQHDILRPNFRPYDPREMETFQKYLTLAKAQFAGKKEE